MQSRRARCRTVRGVEVLGDFFKSEARNEDKKKLGKALTKKKASAAGLKGLLSIPSRSLSVPLPLSLKKNNHASSSDPKFFNWLCLAEASRRRLPRALAASRATAPPTPPLPPPATNQMRCRRRRRRRRHRRDRVRLRSLPPPLLRPRLPLQGERSFFPVLSCFLGVVQSSNEPSALQLFLFQWAR